MEVPTSRYPSQSPLVEVGAESPRMATLAMRSQHILPPPGDIIFREENGFQNVQSRDRVQTPQHAQHGGVELPSIRQAVPEIEQSARPEREYRDDSVNHSPASIPRSLIQSERIRSPVYHKRRRLSNDDGMDLELRERSIPRLYNSPTRLYHTHSTTISPTSGARRSSTTTDSWPPSSRNSPYTSARGISRPRSPVPLDSRSEWRPTLPSLPSLTFDRAIAQNRHPRDHWSEYSLGSTRFGAQTYPPPANSSFEPPTSVYHSPLPYGYQQPRGQSYSGPSTSHPLSLDKTPFSNSHHPGYPGGNYPYALDMNEVSDSKQRKRRGNLPKETTDKLRAWFLAHLQHPYPTEDEKQDLMRQTGLQMNQISNWFINARRRQLPAMINNARAESDARSARGGEGLHREGMGDYGEDGEKRNTPPGESEGEGSPYDEEYDITTRHRVHGRSKQRESI